LRDNLVSLKIVRENVKCKFSASPKLVI